MSAQVIPSGKVLQPVQVPFHGDVLYAAKYVDGSVYVAIKPICQRLGIAWQRQLAKIKADPILAEGVTLTVIPSLGGDQEQQCLRMDLINGWLFGINPKRVNPDARDGVLLYKRECYAALSRHFSGGGVQAPARTLTLYERSIAVIEDLSAEVERERARADRQAFRAVQAETKIQQMVDESKPMDCSRRIETFAKEVMKLRRLHDVRDWLAKHRHIRKEKRWLRAVGGGAIQVWVWEPSQAMALAGRIESHSEEFQYGRYRVWGPVLYLTFSGQAWLIDELGSRKLATVRKARTDRSQRSLNLPLT
jgi:hypothetical protein